ncbi:GtrA family protein [Frankia sp. Cppng1_Ct_nod]|uniref:GtrA family protein n=1 Tax=Frankia sp. Cppng1_Ct_nod TaxID=2897162 RepID=UPI001F5FE4FB|nr:GtrA family protein [Frankia sp. Cppng1_Ct_nod]
MVSITSVGSDPKRSHWQVLAHEMAKFGVVGGLCYLIDVLVFNLCHAIVGMDPLSAKTVSTIVAATCAYIGNRNWSFTHRARTGLRREYTLFAILNAIGLAIALGCLGFASDVLNLHSVLALNLAGNVVGTGLGTIFRFWAYKRWVFLHPDDPKAAVQAPADAQRHHSVPEPAGRV